MRQDKRAAPRAPINENITAREVRLIGADGQQVGIVSIQEALQAAEDAKLDLVEITADALPPVCRIMDYGSTSSRRRSKSRRRRRTRSRLRSKKSSFVQGRKKGITR